MEYGFVRHLDMDFEPTVELVKEQLKSEGFGIMMAIDLKEKFEEKLGIDFKRYVILGTCDPTNACKAIMAEENIGLMLPCNVIVYESDGGTAVGVIRPTIAMQMIDNLDLRRIAKDVERRLKNVVDSLHPVEVAR
ncbi:MAG: hypothetical protein A2Y77_03280 [Planctomycetes bacterium RBG_13_62_9]|nr:MAG: hypothetical protein A2Y77_03280 [Planctomycetes bacterium RBG_13_62_9]